MKEQIDILVKLQEIDTEISSTRFMVDNLPQRLQTFDTRLIVFEQDLVEKTERFDAMKKMYREQEAEVQANHSKINKKEESLRTVKTNKEYQALLKEVDELKKKNSEIEDKMLETLDQIEAAEKELAEKKNELSNLKKETEQEKETIKKETDVKKKRLAKLDAEWENMSKMTETGLLKKFVAIKSKIGKASIVPVKDAICQGCNMNIPPQMYNELQRFDSIKHCPHCQRMIYYRAEQ